MSDGYGRGPLPWAGKSAIDDIPEIKQRNERIAELEVALEWAFNRLPETYRGTAAYAVVRDVLQKPKM